MLGRLALKVILLMYVFSACREGQQKLFSDLDSDDTGIDFRNLIIEDENLNFGSYIYFYNGAGVAIGDINNDGLQDVFFTGNMVKNRLYLNKGDFTFQNITEQSLVAEKQGWCTGASMVDINGDGYLDIYVCRSADDDSLRRENLLFINNHDLTFTESAKKYGLADNGYSTQAAFFDYDKDGDLDCFVLNHSVSKYALGVSENPEFRNMRSPEYMSRLYRNNEGVFVDVSSEAGIISNVLSFGLGIALSDFNEDGWTDMYVSNDFSEPDYLFINNGNGTFSESLAQSMDLISQNSMGSDAADYNNDGLVDLITLDMLPEDNYLQKTHQRPNNFDKAELLIDRGFQPQYVRNMLQKNNGDGTFSEVGQHAGISNTDWSWSALFSDFDLDGQKDLLVTNGYVKDFVDLDFMAYLTDKVVKREQGAGKDGLKEGIAQMPTIKIANYIYKNIDGAAFENKTDDWGLGKPLVSSGAAYADLDNDGDLDIVINNTNDRASVYRNNSRAKLGTNYIRIKLEGTTQNINGIGAKVKVFCRDTIYYQEQFPVRGYQSSVDMTLNFGLGNNTSIDSVMVIWPTNSAEIKRKIDANQTTTFKASNAAIKHNYNRPAISPLFKEGDLQKIRHVENTYSDFTRQTLLMNYLSREGPCMASADVNKDGFQDLFIGGAKGSRAEIWLQDAKGNFSNSQQPAIARDSMSEDVEATFFDANGDGHADLYVASGGYEFEESDSLLQHRLYINDGKGKFSKDLFALPVMKFAGGAVAVDDMDGDGDLDMYVGGRAVPGKYPLAQAGQLLVNNGKGKFTDNIEALAPGLSDCGMVTDAVWCDINKDGKKDLVVVGEWMPILVFINSGEGLKNMSTSYISKQTSGWWNRIVADDIDNDGDVDLVVGNYGTNTQIKASELQPASLIYDDFDGNGSVDPLFCYYIKGRSYPAVSRDDLVEQIPSLKKKVNDYATYAKASIEDLFTADQLKKAKRLNAVMLESVILQNKNGSSFDIVRLPKEVQVAPVYSIDVADFNKDGIKDIIVGGNNKWTRVQFGRDRANHGVVVQGTRTGEFKHVSQNESGLRLRGDVRSSIRLNTQKGELLVFGMNDAPVSAYYISKQDDKTITRKR